MNFLRTAPDFCERSEPPYLFFSERPLFAVTLSAGARRQVLPVRLMYGGVGDSRRPKEELPYCDCEALLDRTYFLPLGDRSWPDDTRVEFEYMDSPAPVADAMLIGGTKGDVTALLGEATVLRFDSGFELWAYEFGATEFVVLFSPFGVVSNTRLRPAPVP
jgi:hypothetical protein